MPPPRPLLRPVPHPPILFDKSVSHYSSLNHWKPITYHFELFEGVFWFKVQTFVVWKKTTTHDAMFVWMMVSKINFPPPPFEYAIKEPKHKGTKEISGKWERGNFFLIYPAREFICAFSYPYTKLTMKN